MDRQKVGEMKRGADPSLRGRTRLLLVVVLATLGFLASTSQASGAFGLAVNFGVGDTPVSVAIGDLDGDGDRDLAVANLLSDSVSVLLGSGDGSFTAATNYPVGERPESVATRDLNGDGFPDIVVASSGPNGFFEGNVSVLLGNGDGTFGPTDELDAGTTPDSVAIGNLNGDGFADLAVANYSSSRVSVLLGNGDGTFGTASDFETGDPGSAPTSVAIADLDGNSFPDLAVANSESDDVAILTGNGDGSFSSPTAFPVGNAPNSVAVEDLNSDRRPDLAVANDQSNNISVLLGRGAGNFRAARNFKAGFGPSSVAIADLDGNRKPDLAAASFTSGNVSVLSGNGDGTFSPASTLSADSGPNALAVGRLNGDSLPDLAVANYFSDNVSVLLNRQARIGKFAVKGPSNLRKGRVYTFKATITNSGNTQATRVRLVVSGRGIRSTSTVGTISAGATRTVNVRLRPSKAGRLTASFKVVSSNAGTKRIRKNVRVLWVAGSF